MSAETRRMSAAAGGYMHRIAHACVRMHVLAPFTARHTPRGGLLRPHPGRPASGAVRPACHSICMHWPGRAERQGRGRVLCRSSRSGAPPGARACALWHVCGGVSSGAGTGDWGGRRCCVPGGGRAVVCLSVWPPRPRHARLEVRQDDAAVWGGNVHHVLAGS